MEAKDSQFKLDDTGQIFYQKDASNPMPGNTVAHIVKGEKSLSPDVVLLDGADIGTDDKEAVLTRLQAWVKSHVNEVLGPLAALETPEENEPEAVRSIAEKVYNSMGITPRAAMEDDIAKLDADMRRVLRNKKIRLGPILVFIPALNKPAAVHLRAVLWSLWHDRPLPPAIPADGIVSFSVADQDKVDEEYYRAIAYPVYGGRAIRVDMLDRLITAVYDSADKGVFKAKHEMAEWLGSSVPDLYAVLEAMGHKKIYDPVDEEKREGVEEEKAEDKAEANKDAEEKPSEEKNDEGKTTESRPAAKPELATFRLKRGKAYSDQGQKHDERRKREGLKHSGQKSVQGKKAYPAKHKKGKGRKESAPKVISASAPKAKPEDSPFAVLQQLKTGSKDEK